MKVYNPQKGTVLTRGLLEILESIRIKRNFNPEFYAKKKAIELNKYMIKHRLKACVIGVSGGIDSATVLGLVSFASMQKKSPIKKIYSLLMPIFVSDAATNQKSALERGKKVSSLFKSEEVIIDLTQNHLLLKKNIDKAISIKGKPWASGQLVSYIKTPTLYYVTSLLAESNLPAIVVGTTNRDEGAYLGYFGKASDGMVDIQLISDIHKSEIYKLGNFLKMPYEIMNAIPSGDMYDGRIDEEVFGTTYDFVELYISYLCMSSKEKNQFINKLDIKSKIQFERLAKRLEKMHKYNEHKYLSKSPSIHFDVYEKSVVGGC